MKTDSQSAPQPRRARRRIAKLIAGSLLVLVGCGAVAAWWVAGQLAAPARRAVGPPPQDLPYEAFKLQSESGASLAGWHISNVGKRGVVVLLHAIRGSRAGMIGRARLFRDAGYSVVMIDLQSHGESTGEHITFGFLERYDALAAVKFAKSQHPGEPIAVVGVSLGGAAALLASPLHIDALILESVYPTVGEAIDNRLRARLGPLSSLASIALQLQMKPRLGVSVDELRPIDKIAAADCPVLVLCGSDDRHTTAAQTRRLFDGAHEPKTLAIFPNAGHVDLERFDPDFYKVQTLKFLASHMNTDD